jgi:hypothetical protein
VRTFPLDETDFLTFTSRNRPVTRGRPIAHRRRNPLPLLAVAVGLVTTIACGSPEGSPPVNAADTPFALKDVTDITRVCQLTGPGAANDTSPQMVAGTDLGHMFTMGDRTYFTFGDTFGERPEGMTGGGGSIWRSNVMAWTADTDPSDCIRFDGWITDDVGWAKELLPAKKSSGEITVIPTYGFAANQAMYLHYMSVRHWGDPGEWDTNLAGLARSSDGGSTWTKLEDVTWPGDGSFQEVSVATVDDELYFWGVPSGRLGGVQLMKVPSASVEDKEAYRYFTGADGAGTPAWSKDPAAAKLILDRPTGELSVVWSGYLHRWLMTTMADNADAVMYEGINPWGPWGEPHYLYRQAELPGLYAPFMHPQYVADGGRTVYFALSLWGPYNVFWYRAQLVKA